ncbi:hypothetical protein CP533_3688 [Ophiocordyceps camponoti-saundersi (nom. inval.)]|nr:hypothetical protein CP533_3688 [Ophiocordyceps camponoti-saundersi (nom. inval.)]
MFLEIIASWTRSVPLVLDALIGEAIVVSSQRNKAALNMKECVLRPGHRRTVAISRLYILEAVTHCEASHQVCRRESPVLSSATGSHQRLSSVRDAYFHEQGGERVGVRDSRGDVAGIIQLKTALLRLCKLHK